MARERLEAYSTPWEFGPRGEWGTMGRDIYRRGGATEDGPEFINDSPDTVMRNGVKMHRVGSFNGEIPKWAQGHGFEKSLQWDDEAGWIIPQSVKDQIDALNPSGNSFLDRFGPLLAGGALLGVTAPAWAGVGAGAEAAAGTGAQASSGSFLDAITNSLSGVSNLGQADLAALIESGTVGNAGAAMEAAAGIGQGGGLGGLMETLGLVSNNPSAVTNAVTGGGGGGGSALSNLLGLGGSGSNLLSVLGTLGATGLGAYASNKQADALKDIATQARNDRLPALNAFNNAIANPNSWYDSAPAMGATDAVLRKLSATHGNPAVNPTAISQAAAYNLGGYNDYLRTTGNLGLSGQDSTIRAQTNAALGDTNLYNALGAGIQQLTQPRNDFSSLLGRYILP